MSDTISRQAAIDGADAIIARDTSGNNDVVKAMTAWKRYVEALHSVQPEQKKGKWISKYNGKPVKVINGIPQESCACSLCGKWLTASDEYAVIGNYCPYCGSFNGGTE